MESLEIFAIQFALSVLVFALAAKWYVVPWLSEKPILFALEVLIIPHAFRHIGMIFLTPVVVSPDLPNSFAVAAGYGDLASGILAIVALVALRRNWGAAITLVWVFNITGTVDLLNALRQAEAVPYFGAAWYIPTFLVPLLLVTHVMIFVRLLKRGREIAESSPPQSTGFLNATKEYL